MTLCRTLSQQLQATLSKVDNLSLVVILNFILRLHLPVGNLLDHFDDIVRLANKANELLVLRLEKLKQGPNRNVLERSVTTRKEPAKVAVDAVAGLQPVLNKDTVVPNCSSSVRDTHVG